MAVCSKGSAKFYAIRSWDAGHYCNSKVTRSCLSYKENMVTFSATHIFLKALSPLNLSKYYLMKSLKTKCFFETLLVF